MVPLRLGVVVLCLVAILGSGLLGAGSAVASQEAEARAFIQSLGDDALDVLQRDDLDYETAVEEFGSLFRQAFDIPLVARFALGRYWRSASEEQRQRYVDLFERVMLRTYSRRFDEYNGQTFEALSVRPEGSRDLLVSSRFNRMRGPPVSVGWRVRPQQDGDFKVLDVVIENVSMALTQRNEYSAIIQRSGGRIDALINALEEQLSEIQSG